MAGGGRVWFVTGIARGFGRELAQAVLARGGVVIGTVRGEAPTLDPGPGELHTLRMEVTDAARVQEAIAQAFGIRGRIDVLVNNAGHGLVAAVEEATDAQARAVFDVNFFGTLNVLRAALPLLRRQRSGHIVNMSSVLGLAPMAGSGLYAATKFAIEGLTQSLALELAPLGIGVMLVEPGSFRTEFLTPQSIRTSTLRIDDYAATAGATAERLGGFSGRQSGNPAKAAQAIIAAVESGAAPLHLVLGSDALQRIQEAQRQLSVDIERWRSVSQQTDFPPGS